MSIKTITCLLFLSLVGKADLSFSINPDRVYFQTPDSLNWEYEEVVITTSDSYNIRTWIYSPDSKNDNSTTLVLVYPDAGNMSYSVYHAVAMAKAGFTVITFDYRGFGKSDDFQIDPNYLYYKEFCNDLIAVTDYAYQNKKSEARLGIWAQSMGTMVAASAFPKLETKIDFIVGEGFVTNPQRYLRRIEELKNKQLILSEPSENYVNSMMTIDVPLLIFGGDEDVFTTVADANDLCSELGDDCQVVVYKGNHLSGFQAWSDEGFGQGYIRKISAFINTM